MAKANLEGDSARGRTTQLRGLRQAVVSSAWRCVENALHTALREDAKSRDIYGSDEVFRLLHECVTEYTIALRGLGEDEESTAKLMLFTLDEAAAPTEPHPALRCAVEEWCRQAFRAAS